MYILQPTRVRDRRDPHRQVGGLVVVLMVGVVVAGDVLVVEEDGVEVVVVTVGQWVVVGGLGWCSGWRSLFEVQLGEGAWWWRWGLAWGVWALGGFEGWVVGWLGDALGGELGFGWWWFRSWCGWCWWGFVVVVVIVVRCGFGWVGLTWGGAQSGKECARV